MTIKRRNGIAVIKSITAFIVFFGTTLTYGIIVYMNNYIKTNMEISSIQSNIDDTITNKNNLLTENNGLQKRYDYIVHNSINLDNLREELEIFATTLEDNIIVPQTESKIFDINIDSITRLKNDENKEFLNFVEVKLGIKSVHKYNTDNHAILRFKILSEIPSIKQVLRPYNVNGVEYSFNENGVTYKMFKKAQDYVE